MLKIYSGVQLPSSPTNLEKYSYVLKKPAILKALYVLSIFGSIGMLRGFFYFFDINPVFCFFVFPVVLFLVINNFLGLFLNFFYKKLDIQKHQKIVRTFWKLKNQKPSIDVFLPVCGENIEILRNTWEGITDLYNPKYILTAHVLDDMANPNVRDLADEFGFQYIVRPNKGFMKKAGNLKYAFERTTGDFILILDADFRPRFDFILDTLPYMSNPKNAIIQTPQFFDNTTELHEQSALQAGAGNIQEYFYRVIQTARNSFGGAICVGSCALYRRSALDEIGGTAQVEHSEDVVTGFELIDKGWKIMYLPIILSKGVCPDDIHSFFKQQTRWCTGSMNMMMNKKFWKSGISIMTKLCYISGFIFYLSNPLGILLTFQTFAMLVFGSHNSSFESLILFIPFIICTILIQFFYIYPKAKPGTLLAHSSASWFYSFAVLGLIFGHVEKWKPTGIKSKLSGGFLTVSRAITTYLFLYLGILLAVVCIRRFGTQDIVLFPVFFWIGINAFYHTYFWLNIQKHVKENHTSRLGFLNLRLILNKAIVVALITSTFAIGSRRFWKINPDINRFELQQNYTNIVRTPTTTNNFEYLGANLDTLVDSGKLKIVKNESKKKDKDGRELMDIVVTVKN